jgi:hypothetical protein
MYMYLQKDPNVKCMWLLSSHHDNFLKFNYFERDISDNPMNMVPK